MNKEYSVGCVLGEGLNEVVVFLWIFFCLSTDIVHAMTSPDNMGDNQYHSGRQSTRSLIENLTTQQQIMSRFQDQSTSYDFDQYLDSTSRKRKSSSPSNLECVKHKKWNRLSPSPMRINQRYFLYNKLHDNVLNQNSNDTLLQSNTDNTENNLRIQSSFSTEVVDPPSSGSLTSTVLIEFQSFQKSYTNNTENDLTSLSSFSTEIANPPSDVLNQNLNDTLSQSDIDNTMDDLRSLSSFSTEIVDPPFSGSLTPTVVRIESLSFQQKDSVVCEASSSSFSTSVLTKSQIDKLEAKERNRKRIY